jgi:hypothetical protein
VSETGVETKKESPLFTLSGSPVSPGKSGLPVGELRALANDVRSAHPLRGALRHIGNEWVLGIKFPSKVASNHAKFLCFRWDGQFGSALTLTAGDKTGWLARGWIWTRHPAVPILRDTRALTIAVIYRGEPVSVVRLQAFDDRAKSSIEYATDVSTEESRRPRQGLLELDEELAFWETFELSETWKSLLRPVDHLQIGWLSEFRKGLVYACGAVRHGLAAPALSINDKALWDSDEHVCPMDFWNEAILPLAEVLRGDLPVLQFVREHRAGQIMTVIADDGEEKRSRNPFHELRWEIGILAECALLADNRTEYGKQVVFSAFDLKTSTPVVIPTDSLSVVSAGRYWNNLPTIIALGVGDLVTAGMQPADLALIMDQLKAFRLGCDRDEAEAAIATMTEEANILNRWTIPWGARVQTSLGPFTEIDFYSYGNEISIILKTSSGHYRWAAFNLRSANWNFNHIFCNRYESFAQSLDDEPLYEELTLSFQLVLASIVRDFVVLDERESAFAIRRDVVPRGRSIDVDSPRIIYIPRVRYFHAPDTQALNQGLDYESRRPHHVRAHARRTDIASPYQQILAERYGFRLEPGYTFVRPHQRGGIAPDREVIYRSRSAMQSLYGVEASIESNGTSDWFRFERDVHDAMARAGFKVDHVASARNGDAGVDVFAENTTDSEFWAIQCKCYAPKRKIGPAVIRELIGALAEFPAGTRGMIVTTSGYSSGSIELAKKSGIELRLLGLTNSGLRELLVV